MDFDILHPFSTFRGDDAYNGKFNGATGWIMQSDVDRQKLTDGFKQAIDEGYDINDEDIQNIIFEQLNCSPSDLTPFDLNKLKKDIEKYYKEVMEKKTTKREFYEMIKEIVAEDETLVAFCEKEIAAIDAKAEKAKERAAAKRAEGDALREAVQAVLTNEFQTIDEITGKVEGEEVTKAKVTARLTQLVKAEIAEKTDVKNEETGKTVKAYKLV